MTISMNTIPSSTLVPLFYAEMDSSAANTTQDSGPALLIGYANADATIEKESLILMPSKDYARQICGPGSQLARMVTAYRETDPFGELYIIAVPEATGAAATVTITVTGAATETGTVNLYIGRTRVQAAVINGDDVAAVATAISAAINANADLPFTSAAAAGVVTLTARHKGLCGNEIPVSLNYYGFGGGEVLPAGIQIAVASGTAGTGAAVLTGTIAAMADEPFDYIGHPFNDAASVNTLSNEMNDTRGNPQTGTPATDLDDDYFDMIQEELCRVVEESGAELDKAKHDQLLTALRSLLLSRSNPFGDIASDGQDAIATALSNLQLGEAAKRNVGTIAGTVAAGDDERIKGALQKTGNLYELTDKPGARNNLGLGSVSTYNEGVGDGQIPSMSRWGLSANSNGYIKLPNGIYFQWYTANLVTGSNVINFPIPFPNFFLADAGMPGLSSTVGGVSATRSNRTYQSNAANTACFIAVGL